MHRVERFLRMLCAACSVILVAVHDVAAQKERAALAKQADIIFVGTVTKIGATSFVGVPISPRTMVVRVDGVLDKPTAVALATGDSVTVEAQEPTSFREGMQATFYGTGWIFGRGVAVREVSHELIAGPLQAAALSQQAESAREVRRHPASESSFAFRAHSTRHGMACPSLPSGRKGRFSSRRTRRVHP